MILTKKHIIILSTIVFLAFLGYFVYATKPQGSALEVNHLGVTATTTSELLETSPATIDATNIQQVTHGVAPASTETLTPIQAPTHALVSSSTPSASVFPWKRAIATVFWVGEGETSDNDYINNRASAWDENWQQSFGGLDDPDKRCGYRPCAFVPKQNPFYIALPYIERNEDDTVKNSAKTIPWYTDALFAKGTLVKDHWVEVRSNGTSCYAQWEDVGPFETDDFAYVFGTGSVAKNTFDAKAGIDLSPAMRDCLHVEDVSTVEWRFVDTSKIPDGPWLKVTRTP
jgi:hypothetical protein